MKKYAIPLMLLVVGFSAGTIVGYMAGSKRKPGRHTAGTQGAMRANSRNHEDNTLNNESGPAGPSFQGPKAGPDRQDGRAGQPQRENDHGPGRENPFRNKKASEIIAFLNSVPPHSRGEKFHQAIGAITHLVRTNPKAAIPLLSSIKNIRVMHHFCRELAMHGGKEGMNAIVNYIASNQGSMTTRAEAIGSLGSLPPEARALAGEGLQALLSQPLPKELQHRLCHAYGEHSGNEAFTNLLSLLNTENCGIRPDVIARTIGRFAQPENRQQLLDVLNQGSWTREAQEGFLRAIAQSNQDNNILLDMLENPNANISQRILSHALADMADQGALDRERLLKALGTDLPSEVKRDLARALVKNTGEEGLRNLWELASAEDAGIDVNSLGAALAEAGGPELMTSMVEMLGKVDSWDTSRNLARSIVEAGGREGVEALLGLAEKGTLSETQLRPLCEILSDTGNPADADRLYQHLTDARGWEQTHPLIRSAYKLAGSKGTELCLDLIFEAESGEVRAAAAEVLSRENRGQYMPELLEALTHEDSGRAQWHLAQALGQGGEEGIKQLTEFFGQDTDDGRRHAILGAIGDMDAYENRSPFLAEALLTATSPHLRMHAAKILAGIGDETAIASLKQAIERESHATLINQATAGPGKEMDFDMKEALTDCLNWAQEHGNKKD